MLSKKIISTAILFISLSLSVVIVIFNQNILPVQWIITTVVIAIGYFLLTANTAHRLLKMEERSFRKVLFRYSLFINLLVMGFLFFFNYAHTGTPFAVNAMDEVGYDHRANMITDNLLSGEPILYRIDYGLSDVGYPVTLGIQYLLFGRSVLLTRLFQVLLGAMIVFLTYLLAHNFFKKEVARLAGVLLLFYPHLLYFYSVTLKEAHMIFLLVVALYSASVLTKRKFSLWYLLLLLLSTAALFFFRQPLAVLVILSVLAGFVFTTPPKKKKGIILYAVVFVGLLAGMMYSTGLYYDTYKTITTSGEMYERVTMKRSRQSGATFIDYIGLPVYVVAAIPTPFPSLVDTEREEGYHKANWYHSGGSFVWNALSFFFIIGLLYLIRRHFFKYIMLIMFVTGYLIILAYSGYVTGVRYTAPIIPVQIMLVAVGLSWYRGRITWYRIYSGIMVLLVVGWSFFQLKSRGML